MYSPTRLLLILMAAVFVAELSIMMAFSFLPPMPPWLENTLDALLLSILIFPVLYFWQFRPLSLMITQQLRMGEELRTANEKLQQEIAERKLADDQRVHILSDLARAAAELDAIYNALPYMVSLHAKDGQYLRANPSLVNTFGFDPARSSRYETAQRLNARFPDGRLLAPENMPSNQALAGEPVYNFEYVITDAKGNDRTLLMNAVPLMSGEQVQGMILAQMDITERKAGEIKEKIHRLVIETAQDGFWMLDLSGYLLEVNQAYADIMGYTREELIGKHVSTISALSPTPELVSARIEYIMQQGFHSQSETHHRHKDGHLVYFSTSDTYLAEENCLFTFLHDITALKQAERMRIETLNQLEKKELAKSRFLAAAGHDLRQPLTAVCLYLDVLKHTGPTDEQNEVLQCLNQSMGTFRSLLDTLLNIAKLDAGVIKPESTPINVSELIIWLEENFAQMAMERQLDWRLFFPIRENIVVRSDVGLVKSVLMNLVSNALKFTPMGAILVSARRRGDDVLFQVWDTGIGIPDEFLKQIFEEFYQVNNPQRDRNGGLGLGLSIVERSLTLLDAKIECRSRVGHGSVFGFRLPLDPASSGGAHLDTHMALHEEVVSGVFASGKRFVIVEDDAMVAQALCKTLAAMGGEVHSFSNANDALLHANIGKADYYIVDYMLGGTLNGLQFLNYVRQRLGKPINAVLVTGDTSALSAKAFAAYDWPVLHKPANISQLLSSLRAQVL